MSAVIRSIGRGVHLAVSLGAVFALTALPGLRPAGAADLYTVTVPIAATADSEVAAKAAAVEAGRKEALARLFARLTRDADARALPSPEAEALDRLIREMSFAEERFGGGQYLADLTVRFEPDGVRAALGEAGVPFAEDPSRALVVLAVLRQGGETLLWEEGNPWRAAWLAAEPRGGLVPLVAPLGDLGDVATIDVRRALALDAGAAAAMASRYGAGGVAVAQAETLSGEGGDVLSIATTVYADAWPVETYRVELARETEETPEALYARGAQAVRLSLEEAWTDRTAIDPTMAAETIRARIPLTGLPDWIAARDKLTAMGAVSRLRLLRLGLREAEVEIDYVGGPERLVAAARAAGLGLFYSPGDDRWVLQPGG